MPKRTKAEKPEAVMTPEVFAEVVGTGDVERISLVPPDKALADLAALLKHIESAPRSAVPGLVADGLKRIEAIRNSLD